MDQKVTEVAPYFVCIDGLAGSGKSTVISDLLSAFSIDGISCESFKLAGIGKSRRGNVLKKIRMFRQYAYDSGTETRKQTEDRLRGRIYQTALTAQIRELKERMRFGMAQVYLLDRSPFMTSTHLKAEAQVAGEDHRVKYLLYAEEAFQTEVVVTKEIGINHIVLLDISPELSFARMIIRYCGNDENDIKNAISNINAPLQRRAKIYQEVCKLNELQQNNLKEPMDNWHLASPLEVVDAEREFFISTIEKISATTKLKTTIVNADMNKSDVLEMVKKSIIDGMNYYILNTRSSEILIDRDLSQ